MTDSNSNKKGKDIWSRITLGQLVAAIQSLGDRVDQLEHETWRLNIKTRCPSSLWGEVIDKLNLRHDEKTRHSLYNIWCLDRHEIQKLVGKKKKIHDGTEKDGCESNIDDKEQNSVSEGKNLPLPSNLSLPLPTWPNTRANKQENIDENNPKNVFVGEISLAFTFVEWKNAFSRTDQKMKDDWTDIFYEKLKASGIRCSTKFKTPTIKKGKRKQNCQYFCCYATCTIGKCPRKYQITLRHLPDQNSSVLFLVRFFGQENHNPVIKTAARKVSGKKRLLIGKRANEIGPLAVYRELVNDADRDLLAAGNYTQCPTIETIKKTASDFHDKSSEHIHGYIHDTGEMPFRVHLYSESQIRRYVNYIRKEKYSYVHTDATGGILPKMSEQKHSLLYAIIFKDGIDVDDTVPLAHAILSSHTVATAIMNAVLQTFNTETINIHLNRCWNVIQGQYNAQQLRSLSFIHLCCCHVIHAIARSLTAAHVDKKTRRATLHIFAFILCSNDIEQLYDILGSVINIFGDPNEQKAKEKLNKMLALEFDVDEESESMLKDGKKIFHEAKEMDDELRVVGEYLRSNAPIIHQSPFNKEAIRRYPDLANIIHNKSKTY
ncbi:unnamed protein product [Rotaria sordida]|uniref:Uncharacterized protein n=1 Tax=Rotaria sordida TaxID=392033 RepID=A0A819VRD4_9BILA|nr:unnamed protein product [Rotaria sordida]